MADEPLTTPVPEAPAPEVPTEAPAAPPASPGADARRAAAVAKIASMVEEPLEEEAPPTEETPAPAEAAPPPAGDPKTTTLQARLVRQDRELQALRQASKGAISLEQLKVDPLAALQAAGHSPDKLLDLWLGTPAAAAKPDGQPRTDGEIVALKQQIQQMGAYLQQQHQATQQATAARQQEQAVATVHQFVTAEQAADRWEALRYTQEEGVTVKGIPAYDLAVEVGNILANRAVEQLGQYATREERVAAATGALEEALDRVEVEAIAELERRERAAGKVGKLKAAAKPAAKGGKAMPAAPSSETKPPRPPTMDERRKNAIRKVEAMYRKGGGE